MDYRRLANKEAFRDVPETCPHVDEALAKAGEAIKRQTGALRDALVDALARAIEAEDRVADLERTVAGLERELENERASASA